MPENNNDNHRPWGFFEVLCDESDHKVKRVTVHPGKRISNQYHRRRKEHWFILAGKGVVTINNKDYDVSEGLSVDVIMEQRHRIMNTGTCDLVFIEVQTGDYFGEDDIIRIEDDFGRV
jgi:mannose-6-phosphate isomerase